MSELEVTYRSSDTDIFRPSLLIDPIEKLMKIATVFNNKCPCT